MIWDVNDWWIILAVGFAGMSCALLGSFLLLRRMSMMGDAISHAVLPGIVVAYWWMDGRAPLAMTVGAVIAGILTALLTQTLHRVGKVEEGASMGVVFTVLFALGLFMMERVAQHVDLDLDCVLFGQPDLLPLATPVQLLGMTMPVPLLHVVVLFLLNAALLWLLYKEWKLSSFDEQLSSALGISAHLMHYLLMILTAVTTVFCFEIVGSILVIAMLVVPAACARMLTDRLGVMLFVAPVLAMLMALTGHVAAQTLPDIWGFSDSSTSGGVAVMAGLIFFLCLLFAPRHGVVPKVRHQRRLFFSTLEEDVLGWLYRLNEQGQQQADASAVARFRASVGVRSRELAKVVKDLQEKEWLESDAVSLMLTDLGVEEGSRLVRSHRLWESWLHQHTPLAMDHLHRPAEEFEHITDAALRRKLIEELDQTEVDPMGRDIPHPLAADQTRHS